MGLCGDVYRGQKIYPRWMYKENVPPLLVKDNGEEDQARQDGFDSITASAMTNPYLINWYWDLEDMSAKQLVVFAKEEYGVELPIEAGQEKLFQAVAELTRFAPQNQNRLILMAHTIKMNYEETIEEIKRMQIKPAPEWEVETIEMEFTA